MKIALAAAVSALLFLGMAAAHAAVSNDVQVHGTVTSMSHDWVTVRQPEGDYIFIPQSKFKKRIRPGDKIHVTMPLAELLQVQKDAYQARQKPKR